MCKSLFAAPMSPTLLLAVSLFAWATAGTPACFGQAPNAPDARQAALSLEQQGRNAEAEAAWRAILKAHPGNPEPYAQIGLLEARQQHYKEAVPYYRKALAIKSNVPGLRLNLGLALFKSGQLSQAIAEFEILRRAAAPGSPEEQRCTLLIGMSYYGLADYSKAIPPLEQAANRDPNNLPLLLVLAHSYLWTHQYQNVLSVYHRILSVNPDSAEADMLAGEAMDEMKDSSGAILMFRNAVKADPKEPNAHFGLGYLLWKQENYPEAAAEFQAELANDPDHAQALVYLADAYLEMNRAAEAQPLLERAVKLDPSFGLAHLDLGIAASEAGHTDEALREFLLAEKQIPNDINVHWHLGKLYRSLGRKGEARLEFAKASSLNKAADDNLLKRMAAAGERHAQQQAPPAGTEHSAQQDTAAPGPSTTQP